MATPNIHPTAIVEEGAQLGADVVIGPLSYVGPLVRLGNGTRLHHHATVEGNTTLGSGNEIFPYALVGGRTQDKKWAGDEAPVNIGDNNIFREHATVHTATFDGGETRVGSGNLFCAYSHIGHESSVGDDCVFSNNATLGGHCVIGDRVVIGGLSAVHQFVNVGSMAMIAGMARVVQDVMPGMIVEGTPATHRAYNKVGLQRAGYDEADLIAVKRLYKHFFRSKLNRGQAAEALNAGDLGDHRFHELIKAFLEKSTRGLA
jgi:UDP-N-acetylglucosamine acyltransferase|tara:strand:+ start:2382 stop:3161 length:780 start_codon:yes stop_codon:yes gene_type:complete